MWTLVFAFMMGHHPTMMSANFENKTQCAAALQDLAHYAAVSKREREEEVVGAGAPLVTWFGRCYHSTHAAPVAAASNSPASPSAKN